MKIKLIGVALVLLTLSAFPQSNAEASVAPKYIYCELTGVSLFGELTKTIVTVNYGDTMGYQDRSIKDESGKKMKEFNSMVDALNYMGTRGWEFVQAYVNSTQYGGTRYFLLRRKAP